MDVVVQDPVVLFLRVCVCVRCLWLLVAHRVDEGGSGRLVLRAILFSPLAVYGVIISHLQGGGRYLCSLLYYVRSKLLKGLGLMRSIPAWKYLIGVFSVFWVFLAIMLF